jgi:hypothetical protein
MPTARVVRRSRSLVGEQFVSERTDGGVRLRRAIVRNADRYAVVDVAHGGPATVHWLIRGGHAPRPEDDGISFVDVCTCDFALGPRPLVRALSKGDPSSGWWSPTYAELASAVALDVEIGDGEVAVARFAPKDERLLSLTEILEILDGDVVGDALRARGGSFRRERHEG